MGAPKPRGRTASHGQFTFPLTKYCVGDRQDAPVPSEMIAHRSRESRNLTYRGVAWIEEFTTSEKRTNCKSIGSPVTRGHKDSGIFYHNFLLVPVQKRGCHFSIGQNGGRWCLRKCSKCCAGAQQYESNRFKFYIPSGDDLEPHPPRRRAPGEKLRVLHDERNDRATPLHTSMGRQGS